MVPSVLHRGCGVQIKASNVRTPEPRSHQPHASRTGRTAAGQFVFVNVERVINALIMH